MVVTQSAVISRTSSGQLVAAQTGKRIRVHAMAFTLDGAGTINLDSATTAITGVMPFGDKGGLVLPFSEVPYVETAAGEALNLDIATATGVYGFIKYSVE